MNKIILPAILIILGLGIFFTYTNKQYAKVKELRAVNAVYEKAIADSVELIKKRDQVVNAYNSISEEDRQRLERILPDHVDNIRLINDIKTLLSRRGITLKDVKTGNPNAIIGKASTERANPSADIVSDVPAGEDQGDTVKSETISITFSTTYDTFLEILNDLSSSLRIIEISNIKFAPKDTPTYEFQVEIKTFWLRTK